MPKSLNIEITKLLLNHNNPRHEYKYTQEEIIEYLCKSEKVYALAKDIAIIGSINPLEIVAVVERENKYFVREGNRRVCAIKLLNDPYLVPDSLKNKFEKIVNEFSYHEKKIKSIDVVFFLRDEDVQPWLQRMHHGERGGTGRRAWNAEQKARDSGDDNFSLHILDYAEKAGLISKEERKNKLSTVARIALDPYFRETFGVFHENEKLTTNLDHEIFERLLKHFITDLKKELISAIFFSMNSH